MMEKLGEPQTHLALKEMIRTVDEDNDGQISFREVRRYIIMYMDVMIINGIVYVYVLCHNTILLHRVYTCIIYSSC